MATISNKEAVKMYSEQVITLTKPNQKLIIDILDKVDPDGINEQFWVEELENKLEMYTGIRLLH